jgi:hypothetical protein
MSEAQLIEDEIASGIVEEGEYVYVLSGETYLQESVQVNGVVSEEL